MKRFYGVVSSLIVATCLHAETASLKMRFVFDGDPPVADAIKIPARLLPAGVVVPKERLLVAPESKGICNLVVGLDIRRTGVTLKPDGYEGAKRRLVASRGRLTPRVILARSGDSLEVVNRDPVGYNLNFSFFKNAALNLVLPPGDSKLIPLAQAEPAPIPVDCNTHPWMRAYLVIFDHSFAAISDAEGRIRIDGLPVGKKLLFKFYHEAGRIRQLGLEGETIPLRLSRLELYLAPGENDLGDVFVPAETFE